MKPGILVAVLASMGACVDMETAGTPIVGTSGDVMTEPGAYVGYRVVLPCEERYVNIGVIGTGSIELTEIGDISAVGNELAAAMGDIKSIWGYGGYGLACEPGVGTTIHTSSWEDVDALIARIGAYLSERDFGLQVSIAIDSPPVPH